MSAKLLCRVPTLSTPHRQHRLSLFDRRKRKEQRKRRPNRRPPARAKRKQNRRQPWRAKQKQSPRGKPKRRKPLTEEVQRRMNRTIQQRRQKPRRQPRNLRARLQLQRSARQLRWMLQQARLLPHWVLLLCSNPRFVNWVQVVAKSAKSTDMDRPTCGQSNAMAKRFLLYEPQLLSFLNCSKHKNHQPIQASLR